MSDECYAAVLCAVSWVLRDVTLQELPCINVWMLNGGPVELIDTPRTIRVSTFKCMNPVFRSTVRFGPVTVCL